MAVSDLMQAAANAARVRNRFSLPDDPGAGDVFDADPVDPVPEGVFGCMSMRGAFAAGIYWNNLLDGLHEARLGERSEEHTSELQSLMRSSYAVFCLKKKKKATK